MILLLLAAATGAVLPSPVRAFVTRAEECRHWAGEEPYDDARAREIARAVRRLRCDALAREAVTLKRRHPRASAAIERAIAD